ncbi:glycosyltransferase [Patescibacteria group bacterium]|nr:glycosyltransferase [Patescibacteria group bacterium]
MLSIIIPTKNEELYLPHLLRAIENQTYKDLEIIVADADSRDKTREIAKAHGCTIVPGGHPGKARNEGAKAAKGELLLFLDADVGIPDEKFIARLIEEFQERDLDIAGCSTKVQSDSWLERFGGRMYNFYMRMMAYVYPRATNCILVKRSLHEAIKGFDETIYQGEDFVYAREASRKGKFAYITSLFFFMSDRRVKTDGPVRSFIVFVLSELHIIFLGPIRRDVFKYGFDHDSKGQQRSSQRQLK